MNIGGGVSSSRYLVTRQFYQSFDSIYRHRMSNGHVMPGVFRSRRFPNAAGRFSIIFGAHRVPKKRRVNRSQIADRFHRGRNSHTASRRETSLGAAQARHVKRNVYTVHVQREVCT